MRPVSVRYFPEDVDAYYAVDGRIVTTLTRCYRGRISTALGWVWFEFYFTSCTVWIDRAVPFIDINDDSADCRTDLRNRDGRNPCAYSCSVQPQGTIPFIPVDDLLTWNGVDALLVLEHHPIWWR